MTRVLLALVVLALLLILGDKLAGLRRTSVPVARLTSASGGGPAPPPLRAPAPAAKPDTPPPHQELSGVDRLARLAVRQRLRSEGEQIYLDSMLVATDSVLQHWVDSTGAPIRVAVVPGGPADYAPQMAGYMQDALARWEDLNLGFRFTVDEDTVGADITVRWIDRFPIARAGRTDVTSDQRGHIRHALIQLAVHDSSGRKIPDAGLRVVAMHEVGHAIGLPHSSDPTDVMYPSARARTLSERDQRTAAVLYELPAGDIRDSIGQ
ncbi:MAG: matrixin family metalloprotease [Gemmatimonadales bacterium]